MDKNSQHIPQTNKKNLLFSIFLNFGITIAEFIGGILSNSLALLSDALHNLSDAFALLISYLAMLVSKRDSTQKNTFGFKRVEILAALLNAIILVVVSIYLFYEAYKRLHNPEPINGTIMFIVAGIGLIANVVSVFLLHTDSKNSLNIKTAYFHLIGDTISSIGVIVASILIFYFKLYWIDPALTFLIGIYILWGTYGILKETVEILMQSSPENIDINNIKDKLESHPKVENIHHIHIWRLSDREIHFECHADVDQNYSVEETDQIRNELCRILETNFNIQHITIQMEFQACHDKSMIAGKKKQNKNNA